MENVEHKKPLKTRFAPSPTGYLHVGGARTALYNFLMARRNGGTFQLRIEDTDRARHDESAIPKIVDDLRWLDIQWDEGIEVGGPNGPYRQSARLPIYEKCISQLLEQGKAYYAFDTQEELDALRAAAEAAKQTFHFTRPASFPTKAQADEAAAADKSVVVRLKVPGQDVTIHDDAFGDVTMPASEQDDFIIRKADGWPTYHLANVVDDATMGVTYIMRGQEFLGQTWRHVVLREALGFPEPGYCHLPLIMDMQGRKLSKRDGDVEVHAFRVAGYLPEVLLNFIALLGWSPPDGKERFSVKEMIESFSPDRVGKSNAKFDRDKLLAFNTDAVAAATPERLLAGFKDYLSLNETPILKGDDALLAHILSCCHGFRTFADLPAKAGVLFIADDAFAYDDKAVEKVLKKGDAAGFAVLRDMVGLLEKADWSPAALQKLLDDYCRDKNAGMGKVAQPIRVAVTGSTISPPITDTLVILGREKTLARIVRCLELT